MIRRLLVWLVISVAALPVIAQQRDSAAALNKNRLILVGSTAAVAYTGSMIGLGQVWYSKSPHQSFRFFNDAAEWKQMDKAGHLFSSFLLAQTGSKILRWGSLPAGRSDRISAITSMLIMSSIEVFDGYSAAYGASATDLLANAAGNGLYLVQQLAWKEVRIYPKFSFHRTSFAKVNPNQLGGGLSEELIKDYNGQTYWLSADMDKFVRFPKWLNLCVGYGAQNMINARDGQNLAQGYHPYRQWYVGLDFDLTAFRGKSKVLNTLIYFANMIRIPAPAIEFSHRGVKLHGAYF